MKALIAIVILAIAAGLGVHYQSPPYRLAHLGQPCDQQALMHRDSPYSSSTWVASPGENFFELRFFDRVEGGVCLRPSWADLRALAEKDPRLAQYAGNSVVAKPGDSTWSYDWLPDPGTLPKTKYVSLFPAAVILNQRLMAAAELAANGEPDAWRKAKPNVLVVGLGSGVGIGVLAHHFPESSITVVDIDRVVIELVHDHYPFLHSLQERTTADGRKRLQLVALDARQFIAAHGVSGAEKYDLIVLDAYTSGSTIPPHLMTREFYKGCADALTEGGIVMSNIISCYEKPKHGNKHLVLGGAIRSQQAAGLPHVHNIPILATPGSFIGTETRNNMLLASAQPIGPREAPKSWERLKAFIPFPELKRGEPAFTSTLVFLLNGDQYGSATVPIDFIPDSATMLMPKLKPTEGRGYNEQRITSDPTVIAAVAKAVLDTCAARKLPVPMGWNTSMDGRNLLWQRTDWVEHSRAVWAAAITLGKDAVSHSGASLLQGTLIDAPVFTDARPNADIYNGG